MDANPRIFLGANNPPPDLTPFDLFKTEIDDLYSEAKNFLDGEPITTQGQADAISTLVDLLRKAKRATNELRVAEKQPLDEAIAEIQARYNPLIKDGTGKCDLAILVCKQAVAPYLQKLDDEKRAIAEKARQDAEAKQLAAIEAQRAARGSTDLEARERAETLTTEAKRADRVATKAENSKAHAKGDASRAMSLRTVHRASITDQDAFAKFIWLNHPSEMSKFLTALATRLMDAGARSIPGVEITQEKVAV